MTPRRTTRIAARGLVAALLAVLAAAPARAQAGGPPAPGASPAAASPAPEGWSYDLAALYYVLPDDRNYVQPMFTARGGRLHVEARYNYEDLHTTSIFGGWAFGGGSEFTWEAIPMLGAVVGQTDGLAPACSVTLAWKELSVYSENEYVVDFADRESNFFYSWSEITWDPNEAFGAGMVVQRTRLRDTDRDLQRGVMARVSGKRVSGALYWFNPGSADDFVAVSVGVGF